ncbi:MAG: hypothetical protein M1813_007924 [Trichoglossum hirsutum]|nr:MAG: hypothetical protein M1813_007924 [Trichoglossum hirsutum]
MAAKAEALVMVVRTGGWRPEDGDRVSDIKLLRRDSDIESPGSRDKTQDAIWSKSQSPQDCGIDLERLAASELVQAGVCGEDQNPTALASAAPSPSSDQLHRGPLGLTVSLEKSTAPVSVRKGTPPTPVENQSILLHPTFNGFLPPGYALSFIPEDALVTELDGCGLPQRKRNERPWRRKLEVLLAELDIYSVDPPVGVEPSTVITSNYSFLKGLVAIFQTVFASVTLYRARGDQIQQYGYAAFGLTVAPYLLMSIVNLIGILVTPEYPAVYLVGSDVMFEASRRHGARFEGVVETVQPCDPKPNSISFDALFKVRDDGRTFMSTTTRLTDDDLRDVTDATAEAIEVDMETWGFTSRSEPRRPEILIPPFYKYEPIRQPTIFDKLFSFRKDKIGCASTLLGATPLAIIGGMTHFEAGHSTLAQRVWTMAWLCIPILLGPIGYNIIRSDGNQVFRFVIAGLVQYGVPAIGGFIVVGQMLKEYGTKSENVEG